MVQQVSELDIMHILSKRLGVSTNVKDLILQYIGVPKLDNNSFKIHNYQLTTQTIVLELAGITFNDFRIDAQLFASNIQKLIDKGVKRGLSNLKKISSKRFEIQIENGIVKYTSSIISNHNQMNSSIEFIYQSMTKQNKQYKLRLFRNGMLQIPGVTESYKMNEISYIVSSLIYFYQKLFECDQQVICLNQHIAMCNYLAQFPILSNQRLDIVKAHIDHKKNPNLFSELCVKYGLQYIQYEVAIRRVVLYVKFLIPKERDIFSQYNASSTSNRRSFKSITIQITQRGIIIIQGSTGVFSITKDIIQRFQLLAVDYFPLYLRSV